MIRLIKVLESFIVNQNRRAIKSQGFGKNDIRTSLQIAPPGVDAAPTPGMIAVYAPTKNNGHDVVIGYINRNAIAEIGEHRIFSTDDKGNVKTYVHLKNDGSIEIGGANDFAVRYSELEQAFNKLKSDFNDLIDKFNAHVHSGVQTGGGTSAVPTTQCTPSTADISGAKIETIKTP